MQHGEVPRWGNGDDHRGEAAPEAAHNTFIANVADASLITKQFREIYHESSNTNN